MWFVDLPVKRARAACVLLHLDQLAIRDDAQRSFHGRENLRSREIVRVIKAGKPQVIRFSFALRPDLSRSSWVVRSRLYKIQAAAAKAGSLLGWWLGGVIGNNDREFFRKLISPIVQNRDLLFRDVVFELER